MTAAQHNTLPLIPFEYLLIAWKGKIFCHKLSISVFIYIEAFHMY